MDEVSEVDVWVWHWLRAWVSGTSCTEIGVWILWWAQRWSPEFSVGEMSAGTRCRRLQSPEAQYHLCELESWGEGQLVGCGDQTEANRWVFLGTVEILIGCSSSVQIMNMMDATWAGAVKVMMKDDEELDRRERLQLCPLVRRFPCWVWCPQCGQAYKTIEENEWRTRSLQS